MADPLVKLENAVKKLAAQMAELRSEADEARAEMAEFKGDMAEFKDGTLSALANIQQTQTALTHAMTQAIKEMAVSKSFEARLSRLESEVFGSKH